MTRIVAVSNRVADPRDSGATGGLAIGVTAALEKSGGMWFGWSGELTDDDAQEPQVRHRRGITYTTIDLDRERFERYYNGFCNNTLWPVLHYRLGFFEYHREEFEAYLAINELFARKLVPLLTSDDVVWVHDFHLIPLGTELRRAGLTQPVGFFLHTPLPSFEVLRAVPVYRQLLAQLCAYDIVGFQTERDLGAFRDAISQRDVGGRVLDDGSVVYGERTLRAGVFPIGIDVATCTALATANTRSRKLDGIRDSLLGRRLLIGVDRLDYSKGLPKRFQAYERLLAQHEEHRGTVVFMQVAPRTRSGEIGRAHV